MRYACALFFVLATACGDDSGDGGASSGRGSAACQDWQDAICDFAVSECNVIDRATCDENYQSITCASDARASECANALNSASCGIPPPSCDLTDLANPAPARQACNDLLARLCAHLVECNMSPTADACMQQVATIIDCNQAIGFTLAYEDCLATVDGLACTIAALPDICHDVIRLQR